MGPQPQGRGASGRLGQELIRPAPGPSSGPPSRQLSCLSLPSFQAPRGQPQLCIISLSLPVNQALLGAWGGRPESPQVQEADTLGPEPSLRSSRKFCPGWQEALRWPVPHMP